MSEAWRDEAGRQLNSDGRVKRNAIERKQIPILMVCKHHCWYKAGQVPGYGEEVYCIRCMGYTHRPFPGERDSEGVEWKAEWRWLCRRVRCLRGIQSEGAYKLDAIRKASRHVQKYSTHEVWVISPEGVVIERWVPAQSALPGLGPVQVSEAMRDVPF